MNKLIVSALAVVALSSGHAYAQDTPASTPAFFPFVIPWDDAAAGTATDMSFLNAKPAGVNGAIIVKDGHFAESKTGARVRFLGTNFTFMANYPTHDDADKIAAHIAKVGINIIRIHHHDMNYNTQLWVMHKGDFRDTFDPAGVDKLDYLIAALKKNGIYVDLNLHVSRWYTPENGFPASIKNISIPHKGIDEIDRHMIDLQKEFARNYLGRVNPYTGLSYVNDPAVALIEINNENSLAGDAKSGTTFVNSLPPEFRSGVVKLWNDYLAKKYQTTAALKAAWTDTAAAAAGPTDYFGPNQSWMLVDFKDKNAKLTQVAPATATTMPAVDLYNPTISNPDWAKVLFVQKVPFEEGKGYKLTFRAKADKARSVTLTATNPDGGYPGIGLRTKVTVGTDWATYKYAFAAASVSPSGPGKLTFIVGGDTGTLSLADVRLSAATGDDVIPEGASLEARNLDLPDMSTVAQRLDWRTFIVDAETAYITEMRDFVRNDLKSRAAMTGSQVGQDYSGLASFKREAASDFIDGHAYWQHPQFPGVQFDHSNWRTPNTPMATALATWLPTTFNELATYRMAGKPYTVSEYCNPAPNDYQAEMFPEIASFAALQDWDAVFQFDYGTYGSVHDDKPKDAIQGWFAMQANPAKEGFTPLAALIFRQGLISPLTQKLILHIPPASADTLKGGGANAVWSSTCNGKMPNMIANRIEVVVDPTAKSPSIQRVTGVPGDSSAQVGLTYEGAQYIATSPRAVLAAGYLGGRQMDFGALKATFPSFGNNFASLAFAAIDGKPVTQSQRLLLTICGKAENIGMGWNDDRTTVGANFGKGPAQAEGIPSTLTIANSYIKHAWALDPTGKRTKEVPVTVSGGIATLSIGPDYKTIWYEIGL
ncbi:MAG TPA: cellulase family glycosylhydrolase [Capsulimonadaceae bacterium]|jgi:hypothetical protein